MVDYDKNELLAYKLYEAYRKKCINTNVRYATCLEFTIMYAETLHGTLNRFIGHEKFGPIMFTPYCSRTDDIWCCMFSNNNKHLDYLLGTKDDLIKEIEACFDKEKEDIDPFKVF